MCSLLLSFWFRFVNYQPRSARRRVGEPFYERIHNRDAEVFRVQLHTAGGEQVTVGELERLGLLFLHAVETFEEECDLLLRKDRSQINRLWIVWHAPPLRISYEPGGRGHRRSTGH